MSEANEMPQPAGGPLEEHRHAERRRGEQRRIARALWQGATALLLGLLAIVAVGLLGWRILDIQHAIERDRSAGQLAIRDLETIRVAIGKLETEAAATRAALAALEATPRQLDALTDRVAGVEERIQGPQRVVARTEATDLVELAGYRLSLERDVNGAVRLFEAAAARLADFNDAATLRMRAQLEHDLELLRAVPEPDIGALGARLAAVGAAVRDLPMLGMIKNQYVPPGDEPTPAPGLARVWQQLRVLGDLVTVRRVSDAAVQLVSMEEIGVRRHHLETLLFAARLAALRGDDVDYAATMADARDWLGRYFDTHDAKGQAVEAELASLARSHVSPDIPDVSGSLKLLRRSPK
jgi:uroporphyrin-3 C-methyltransferase